MRSAKYSNHKDLADEARAAGLIEAARKLRNHQTPAESLMGVLLDEHFPTFEFEAQVPFERYIMDFYSQSAKVCIELDGRQHSFRDNASYDCERDQYLQCRGITVIRFANREMIACKPAVINRLRRLLDARAGVDLC